MEAPVGDVTIRLRTGSRITIPAPLVERIRGMGRLVAKALYPCELVRALWPRGGR
jgi:hypothetical protein